MKRLLVGDRRENLLITLETLLRHWGYRVLVSSRPAELISFLKESPPDLLVVGANLLSDDPALHREVSRHLEAGPCPLVVLAESVESGETDLPHELLRVPLDIFALFALLQTHLEKHPRKNLRLSVQIPGMLCKGETSQLSELLSLSAHGVFIKTGFRLEKEDHLKVIIPLMGMGRELEIEGRVLYRVHPEPHNGYLQGVGIEFTNLTAEDRLALEAFLENRFLKEVTDQGRRLGHLSPNQLQSRVTLQLL
jgi:CheY-like chemotaxis protein